MELAIVTVGTVSVALAFAGVLVALLQTAEQRLQDVGGGLAAVPFEDRVRPIFVPASLIPGAPLSAPRIREKSREEMLRDRFEALCRASFFPAFHCERRSCGQEGLDAELCHCPCPGCVRASEIFRQAVEELGPTPKPKRQSPSER